MIKTFKKYLLFRKSNSGNWKKKYSRNSKGNSFPFPGNREFREWCKFWDFSFPFPLFPGLPEMKIGITGNFSFPAHLWSGRFILIFERSKIVQNKGTLNKPLLTIILSINLVHLIILKILNQVINNHSILIYIDIIRRKMML